VDHPIQVEQLRKSYGSFAAVKGIDFEVRAGEVFGLLGPNGAGKTSTVEILEGLRARSGGRVRVPGCDPEWQTRQLKDRIGVCAAYCVSLWTQSTLGFGKPRSAKTSPLTI